MLLTLKAPRAYFPFKALANKSRVCVSGIVLFVYQLKTTTVKERGIIGKPSEKKRKIIPQAESWREAEWSEGGVRRTAQPVKRRLGLNSPEALC